MYCPQAAVASYTSSKAVPGAVSSSIRGELLEIPCGSRTLAMNICVARKYSLAEVSELLNFLMEVADGNRTSS